MDAVWFTSYVLLWIIVLLLGVAALTLARQVGIIYIRLGPSGARVLPAGPSVGTRAADLSGTNLMGQPIKRLAASGRRTLLVFTMPGCTACSGVAPGLRSVVAAERKTLDVVLVSRSDDAEANRRFAQDHDLGGFTFIGSPETAVQYGVNVSPYAVLLDADGVVRAKGLINNLLHIQSLLNAGDIGQPNTKTPLGSSVLQRNKRGSVAELG
jgi:methylamine dehydrogenase accessory protein MauD